ncbi:MAG: hypothetical protein HZB38_01645 [Planctomycetes bacterium]|nr:hypothetical protein [Planctomycetota bacterium]
MTNVDIFQINGYVTPAWGSDTTPPEVTVLFPNGGETLGSSSQQTIQWTATDNRGEIAYVNIYVTFDGGANWDPLALFAPNTGSFTWFVQNRPTAQARIKIDVFDPSNNQAADTSDAFFTIASTATGRVPTTLRDFDMPGSQAFDAGPINSPAECRVCHGDYNLAVEPHFNWRGTLMAYASIDPIFLAAMDVANHDAPESGDLCLRCHMPRGWLQGRSTPTNGSQMLADDRIGVACALCHRLVDPIYQAGVSPVEDEPILAALRSVPTHYTSGQMVVDPSESQHRGPYEDPVTPHEFLYSPLHREAEVCGMCHDVSNPVFVRQPDGTYLPGAFDQPAADFGSHQIGPAERTYSEWFFSAYNTPQGVYNPELGGNRDYVTVCQDCHMRAVTGQGSGLPFAPERNDLPLHDMTGGSVWLTDVLDQFDPSVDKPALDAAIIRSRYMLQHAAQLELQQVAGQLEVRVINRTGHKLPTGYPEGRRMWLRVQFYDARNRLVGESGQYDANTGTLVHDSQIKVYEAMPVIGENIAPVVGLPANTEFHFALNNKILKDNRIPPLGFTNAAYNSVGAAPVGAVYADGQNWDSSLYAIPRRAVRAEVTLLYQSMSKEFVEFLRDNATTNGIGMQLYMLWAGNGMCPPETMASGTIGVTSLGSAGTPTRVIPSGATQIPPP